MHHCCSWTLRQKGARAHKLLKRCQWELGAEVKAWMVESVNNFSFLGKISFGYDELSRDKIEKCLDSCDSLNREKLALRLVVRCEGLKKLRICQNLPDLFFSDLILVVVTAVIEYKHEMLLVNFNRMCEEEWAKKLKLKNEIHNFSSKDIDETLLRMIEYGLNFKPHRKTMSAEEMAIRIMNEYRIKVMKKKPIRTRSLRTFSNVIAKERLGGIHAKYFEAYLKGVSHTVVGDAKKTVRMDLQALLDEEQVVLECDKSWGLCVLDRNGFKEAEKKVIDGLKGQALQLDMVDVVDNVIKEEKRIWSKYYTPDLLNLYKKPSKDVDEAFPKIRIAPKLHKLTKMEKESGDLSLVKFRPIICAVRPPTRRASEVLFNLGKELKALVLKQYLMEKKFPKSSFEFCQTLRTSEVKNRRYRMLASIDIGSAYDNTTLENCLEAVVYLGALTSFPKSKMELMLDLLPLVLQNNIIQHEGRCVRLADVVPQGGVSSGTLLDLVLLCGEVNVFGAPDVKIALPSFLDFDLSRPKQEVDNYQRFLDDTFATISTDSVEDMMSQVTYLRSIFPTHMVVNFDLHPYIMQFLEVFVIMDISTNGLDFTLKKDFLRPMKCNSYIKGENSGADLAGMFVNERYKAKTCTSRELLEDCQMKMIKMTAEKFRQGYEVLRVENEETRAKEVEAKRLRKTRIMRRTDWTKNVDLLHEVRASKQVVLKPRIKYSRSVTPTLKWRHTYAMSTNLGFTRGLLVNSAETIKTLLCKGEFEVK